MLQQHKPALLALCAVLVLAGCTSTARKPQTAPVPTDAAQSTQATDTKTASEGNAEGAQTSSLQTDGGINSSALTPEQQAARAEAERQRLEAERKQREEEQKRQAIAALLSTRLVHFDFDSAELQSADYQTLLAHARYLSQTPAARVQLTGHADERGTREYNMALGQRRAEAVEAFLKSNGARQEQLESVSMGKEEPLNDGHDENAWAENRRVELGYKNNDPTPGQ